MRRAESGVKLKWLYALIYMAMVVLPGCNGKQDNQGNNNAPPSGDNAVNASAERRGIKSNGSGQPGRRASGERGVRAANPGSSVIAGVIRDASGQPASGALINLWTFREEENTTLTWTRVGSTRTNSTGEFRISSPAEDRLAITASKPGYAVVSSRELKPNMRLDRINLQMMPESHLSGTVVRHDGTPVAGAEVAGCPELLSGAAIGEFQTTTDSDGRFSFRNVPEGSFPLVVSLPGGELYPFKSAAPADNHTLTLPARPLILDGRLISDDAELDLTSATVELPVRSPVGGLNMMQTTRTNENGEFDFGPVAAISAGVHVTSNPPGHFAIDVDSRVNGRRGIFLNLEDGKSTTVLIAVSRGKPLRGRAVDVDTDSPVAGVRIYPDNEFVQAETGFVETDANGEFFLPNVFSITHIQVRAENYHLVSPDWRELQKHDMATSLTLKLARKPWVRGRVHDGFDNPVAGASLKRLARPGGDRGVAVELDQDGYFQVPLVSGKYVFIAEAPGRILAVAEVNLGGEDVDGIELHLDNGRRLEGMVASDAGHPVAGAQVLAQLARPSEHFGRYETYEGSLAVFDSPFDVVITDRNGRFAIDGCPKSAGVALLARSADYVDSSSRYVPPYESAGEIRLVLPPSGMLTGVVVDEEGEPVPDATCRVSKSVDTYARSVEAVSTTTGSFVLKPVHTSETLRLFVLKEGFQGYDTTLRHTDKPLSVTLLRSMDKTLLVRCLDLESGDAVESQITAQDLTNQSNPTAEPVNGIPGLYRIDEVKSGSHILLRVTAKGYMDATKTASPGSNPSEEWTIWLRPTGRVTGRIVDENGNPVTDAVITPIRQNSPPTKVDQNGRFELEMQQAYSGLYAKRPDGTRSVNFYPQAAANQVTDIGDIVVLNEVDVVVRVTRLPGDEPVAGADVRIAGARQTSGKTDDTGEFSVKSPRGETLYVGLPDWNLHRSIDVDCAPGENKQTITIPVGGAELKGKLIFEGEPVAGTVSGRNESTGASLQGVAASAEAGFVFKNLPPGSWTFNGIGTDSGFTRPGRLELTLSEEDEVEQDIVIKDEAVGVLVVDENNKPVVNATVWYTGSGSGNTHTGNDGRATIIAEGKVSVRAEKLPGRRSEIMVVNTSEQQEIRLVVKPFTGRVECTVLSILDGLPLTSAFASLKNSEDGVSIHGSTDNGTVIMDNIPPGTYDLRVTATGYTEVSRSVTVEEGSTLSFTDVLSPGASVGISVSDSRGFVVPGVQVQLVPISNYGAEESKQTITNDRGEAILNGIAAGTYQVTANSHFGSASTVVSTENQYRVSTTLTLKGAESGQ